MGAGSLLAIVSGGMLLVTAGFAALAATDSRAARDARPDLRRAAVVFWMLVVIVGWSAIGYLALGYPGGLEAVWWWALDQMVAVQAAMWLLLLPWMGALWIAQTSWPGWLQTVVIISLMLLTVGLSLMQFSPRR
jgi:hypothetical protein